MRGPYVAGLLPPALLLLATGYALLVVLGIPARKGWPGWLFPVDGRRTGGEDLAEPMGPSSPSDAHASAQGDPPELGLAAPSESTMRPLRIVLAGASVPFVLLLVCCATFVLTNCSRPEIYEVPWGYRGWLIIRFEDPACPPLKARGIRRVISFDSAGRACTSDTSAGGARQVRFEYIRADGRRTEIPDAPAAFQGRTRVPPGVYSWILSGSADHKRETSFVGAQEDTEQATYTRPEHNTRTVAIRTAEEAARRLGASSHALEGVEFGTLAEQRREMSEEWNSALGAFIRQRRVRSPQGGYHYPFDAETPTWLVKIRGTFQAPSGATDLAVVRGMMLMLTDARTGEMIGTEDLQASPED